MRPWVAELHGQEVAREARLPAEAFRPLWRGIPRTIGRADELCKARGMTMMIGQQRDDG